ncbi:MAG TPA: sterol desaturase family protein [Terriglobales bacterium]|nr:sterol desaturase family protein [Terriglobales bacterium]
MHERVWSYVFVCGFLAVAAVETFVPLRSLRSSTPRRWLSNIGLYLSSLAAARLILQLSALALAFSMQATSRGLLNQLPLPFVVQFAVGLALVDLRAYTSHRLFHAVGLMWRVHQVHHSESELDLTTGFRFHPLETLVSQGLLLVTVVVSGPPPGAVAFNELIVVVLNLLHHANLRFPESADRVLRLVIVTPGMHRVHHSEAVPEQNANFGVVFSLWDRLFGTYRAGLTANPREARYGLAELPRGSELNAAQVLFLPFRRTPDPSPSKAECPQE